MDDYLASTRILLKIINFARMTYNDSFTNIICIKLFQEKKQKIKITQNRHSETKLCRVLITTLQLYVITTANNNINRERHMTCIKCKFDSLGIGH